MRRPSSLVALLSVLVLVAGCGGRDSTGSTAATSKHSTSTAAEATMPAKGSEAKPTNATPNAPPVPSAPPDTSASFTPKPHADSGGGSTQFETKGGDNSIQETGSEAGGSELDQAAAALHTYLEARAAGAWQTACANLAASAIGSLTAQLPAQGGEKQPTCAEFIAAVSAGMPAYLRREIVEADVGSLRADGNGGFLLFHGAHGMDYFMPMAREDGRWKVAALAASPLG